MGGGFYNMSARMDRSTKKGYETKSREEIFTQTQVSDYMNPKFIDFRECRNSEEHPNVTPIIIGLDVTGSMGNIPHHLIKTGLPTLVSSLIEKNEIDPALCFIAVGDHLSDRGPLQVGQFEASDEKLDHWLTSTWLEGNGGGNGGESYALAWKFAAEYVKMDASKGILITIGDEPIHDFYQRHDMNGIFKHSSSEDTSSEALLKNAQKNFYVHHIHCQFSRRDSGKFKDLLGENLHIANSEEEVIDIIVNITKSTAIPAGANANTSTSTDSSPEIML